MANYNFTFNNGSLTYKDADGNECAVGGSGDSNQLAVLAIFTDTRTTLTKTWNEIYEKCLRVYRVGFSKIQMIYAV